MGESDLLQAAESTMEVVAGVGKEDSAVPSSSTGNDKANSASGSTVFPAVASIPASALLLGGVVDKDDEYD